MDVPSIVKGLKQWLRRQVELFVSAPLLGLASVVRTAPPTALGKTPPLSNFLPSSASTSSISHPPISTQNEATHNQDTGGKDTDGEDAGYDEMATKDGTAQKGAAQTSGPSLPSPVIRDSVFCQIFERSPDAMSLSVLADGTFIAVNDRFLQLSEYERAELIGHRSTDLNFWPNPDDRAIQRQKIEQQQSLYNEEGGFRTKSGTMKIVRVSAEIISVDGCPCVLCSIRDITQEKQAEDELRLANERDRLLGKIALNIRQSLNLQQILDSTVIEVRQLLNVERVFVARFTSERQGYVAAESVLAPFPSLAKEVVGREVYDELSEVFSQLSVRAIDDMAQDVEQSSCFRLLVSQYQVKAGLAVPIKKNGELLGVLVAHQCTDPRPWSEFERQLIQRLGIQVAIAIQQAELYKNIRILNASLEQKVHKRTQQLADRTQELEELGEFRDFLLHAVTHDLRTSVVGTGMVLGTLNQQPGDSIQLSKRVLGNMIEAINSQRDKLDALQEVHTMEIYGVHLHRTTFSLRQMMETVLHRLHSRAEESQVTLQLDLPDALPPYQGDRQQLERVLHHIISNAIIHNAPGISVIIRTTLVPDASPQRLRFEVIDNGRGLTAEQCACLFRLTSDCPQSSQLGGIRLGLYLCRQIIEAHGGQIGVESQPRQGATLWFELPLTTA